MSVSPDVVINTDTPRVPDELLEALRELDLPTFGHLLESGFAEGLQHIVGPAALAVGRVVTVKLLDTDSRMLHYSTALVQPGDFVVIEAGANVRYASVGGGIAGAFAAAGVVGIAVDGRCTDIVELRESGMAVYSRGLSPFTTRSNGGPIRGSINVPVSVGAIAVTPGLIALGDENGLLFATAEQVEALIPRVHELLAWEPPAMARVRAGERLADILIPADDLAHLNTLAQRKATTS
ncbi:RraA family protein [Microbacteriaceae bacterium VKM Ac-2854]|nr:RraA family protein [Microbacteriaceae bacterium VKM Ac-2854]